MNTTPLVSIHLPTYNHQKFISESIESVLSQDYDNIEIVIGDDCSHDDTWIIVQDYQKKYPTKIKAFQNKVNLGITGNCNEILNRCTGKYVAFFSGDDLFNPGKIKAQVDLMERNENVVLCYHDTDVFDSDTGQTIRFENSGKNASKPIVGSAHKVAKKMIQNVNQFMSAMCAMVKRSALPASGFDKRLIHGSDWLMWVDILASAPKTASVAFIPDVFVRYRKHSNSITATPEKYRIDFLITLAIIEDKYPQFIRQIDKARAYVRYLFAVVYVSKGQISYGRYFLWGSLRSGYVSVHLLYMIVASYCPFIIKIRDCFRQSTTSLQNE